jgi:glycerol-3-phosphate acyltransferase PlsY
MIRPAAYLVLAFLAGSLPFGLWIGRWGRGVDVRAHGSGNIGATNVLRVAGPVWGVLALVLDIGKGWVAVGPGAGLLGLAPAGAGGIWPALGALAVTGGHVFSPWLGFRGGKGVATFVGAAAALALAPTLVAVGAFALALAGWRYVSLASLAMAAAFPVAALWLAPPVARGPVAAVGALLALLIAWRHAANLARLRRGAEPRLGAPR